MSKNIIVTGCSRGVGLEICKVLLEQGNTVYGIAVVVQMSSRHYRRSMQIISFLRV